MIAGRQMALSALGLALGCSAHDADPTTRVDSPALAATAASSGSSSTPAPVVTGSGGSGLTLNVTTDPTPAGGSGGNTARPSCDKGDPCACIRVGTLGITGTWGQGNLFDSWVKAAGDAFENFGDAQLTPELLARVQILIVQDVHNNCNSSVCGSLPNHYYSEAELAALEAWIRAGNGFFTLNGYFGAGYIEVQNVNRMLAPAGIQYDSGDILGSDSTVPITTWNQLPETSGITAGISAVGMNNGRQVLGTPPALALGPNGETVLRATKLGEGHVVAWGDEWITYDTEWLNSERYQVGQFWQNVMSYLTPLPECAPPIPPEIVVK